MNITKYIRFFQRERRKREISSRAADLYIFLLTECVESNGENPIRLSDRYIAGSLGFSRYLLRKARAQLVEEGFISMVAGDGSLCTTYRLTHVPAHAAPSIQDIQIDSEGRAVAAVTPAQEPERREHPATRSAERPTTHAGGPASEIMPLPFEQVEELYHAHCPTLPRNKTRTAAQVEEVRRALLQMKHGTEEELREALKGLFDNLERNAFAHGKNNFINRYTGKPWKATMKWLFKKDNWQYYYHPEEAQSPREDGVIYVDATPSEAGVYNPLGLEDIEQILEFNNALKYNLLFQGKRYQLAN